MDLADGAQAFAPAKRGTRSLSLGVVRAIGIGFFVAKLGLLIAMQPYMDETYYFLWGQHLSLSYFDHPSLIGWTQGLSAAIFGWNMAALREPVFLTLCGDLYVLYLFARRLGGLEWRSYFWMSAALFLSMPIMFAVTGAAIPDHLLVLFGLLAIYLLYSFLDELDKKAARPTLLYAGAAAVGLATLSKYYGVLIGVAFLVAIVLVPRYRSIWRNPHLYGAAVVAAVLQAPVLIWNIQNDFASFAFITGGRVGVTAWWQFSGTPGYLAGIIAVISPFLIWPAVRFAIERPAGPQSLPQALAWISTLIFLAASTVTGIIVHWNGLAYVAVLPFLARYIRSPALLVAHFCYAAVVFVLFAFNYAVIPFAAIFGYADQAAGWGYGWDHIASEVASLREAHPGAVLASTDYTIASELGFAMHDRGATSLSPRSDAFDFWSDARPKAGSSVILVTDGWRPLYPEVRAQFARVTEAGNVETSRFGRTIDSYSFYVGEDYTPAR